MHEGDWTMRVSQTRLWWSLSSRCAASSASSTKRVWIAEVRLRERNGAPCILKRLSIASSSLLKLKKRARTSSGAAPARGELWAPQSLRFRPTRLHPPQGRQDPRWLRRSCCPLIIGACSVRPSWQSSRRATTRADSSIWRAGVAA